MAKAAKSTSTSISDQIFGAAKNDNSRSTSHKVNGINFAKNLRTSVDLFAVAPQAVVETRRQQRERLNNASRLGEPATRGKRSREPIEPSEGNRPSRFPVAPVAKGRGVPVSGEAEPAQRKRHLSHATDKNPSEDLRTVFVGNLPNDTDRKALAKVFKDCGPIESVRLRCLALQPEAEKARGRAVRVLRKELKSGDHCSATAYILFEARSSVPLALQKNGFVWHERHLIVTREDDESKSFPPLTSMFLGNLPRALCEEDVWRFFEANGVPEVKRVRLIKDKESGECKGIGYVEFTSPMAARRALGLRERDLGGRPVRICNVQKSPKASKALRRDRRKEQMLQPFGPPPKGQETG